VPELFTAQVRPWQLTVKVGTGGWLPLGSTMVTDWGALVADTCHSSRTVNVTWNGAPTGLGAVKVRIGNGPLPLTVVPDEVPKLHVKVSELAFSSVEARPSNVHTFWLQV
jgi:hypothetical protein